MKLKQSGTLAPADQPWQLIRLECTHKSDKILEELQ